MGLLLVPTMLAIPPGPMCGCGCGSRGSCDSCGSCGAYGFCGCFAAAVVAVAGTVPLLVWRSSTLSQVSFHVGC